ncbi:MULTISPECIES: methyltransferase family protein [Sphingobacteriaceae]|uniref:Lipid A phosphate methyltransferase n=3 Tax=Sphingobacteriaceae TaxID=84566 RepID=A0A081PHG6_9SPHI|nr:MULTISPECIES: isoprenylcysteine carboxylmethyltransferase family protein [Sphingobacteriaceae]KEQ30139.1 lipid A phosphate methyltransferase [Pedobacter antarcticus 4BY]MBA8986289.1 protein-S-isoprenylcysteine O-methyltransferase Ste14 [Sphingobacterium soli]WGQ12779.1 isoprenylcysteine carboxylmethyltransferase family protein [Sphingobacterium faecium]SFE49360.1 Protein-S-isoprenylcysteine O-methyltransferase Ste14 [Pedobacter antarcticus]GGE19022.1 lipid A Kdo2 1-phosphate O-methyltransfe
MALKEELEKQGNWLFRYRSYIPIGILIIALSVLVYESKQNNKPIYCSSTYEIICLSVGIIGLGIRVYTVGYTPKNTSGRNTHEGQVADTLNKTGIYSTVRHPLYLGNFLMWLGPALLTGNMWFVMAFILFYWLYYERIMFAEEQFLERKFGEAYTKWAASVPAFIPDFSKFRRPEVSFSIKKVLKKEKNGLFALFLIFGVFDFIGEWLNNHAHFNILIIAGTVITMLMYVVLKFIKSRTSLLNESR